MYSITDIGTLPGTVQSIATGINDLGQVIGYANNPSDGTGNNPRPFLYSNGQITPVTPIGGGVPNALNDAGQIVGGQFTSINNSGQYVGSVADGATGNLISTLVSGTKTTSLGNFRPVAINDSGVIVGEIPNAVGGLDPAVFKNGQVTDLIKTLGLNTVFGQSISINKSGDIYFYYLDKTNIDAPTYMILKSNGQLLPTTGAFVAMNNSNQLVGNYFNNNGNTEQLTELLVPSSQTLWQGLRATAINDAGQIVGVGVLTDGESHAFLMTPIPTPAPEASTLLIMAIGIVAFAVHSTNRKLKWISGI